MTSSSYVCAGITGSKSVIGKCRPSLGNWAFLLLPAQSFAGLFAIRLSSNSAGEPSREASEKSWRADETYVSVGGKWMYLYRAVDEHGKTIESYLSRTRDKAAAKAFFRRALKRHGEPRTITLDGFEPSHSALRVLGMRNEFNFFWENPVKIRCCPYLNNIVEQDHRHIKFRLQPMLGFKRPYNARRVIAGVELAHKIHKQQYDIPRQFGSFPAEVWRNVLAT